MNASSLAHFIVKSFAYLLVIVCFISILPMLALRFVDPTTSSFIQLNELNNNRNIVHEWVDLEEVSLYFPNAVMASEDQTFPQHHGLDFTQIMLVLSQRKDGLSRGASTITQQTVKNLFLWPERSLLRKAIEAWLSLWMELIIPKERILELYINYAQFGSSVFGVQAASRHYFDTDANALTPRQSALIAASLPTPSRSNPAQPSEYLQDRADYIQDQMPRVGGRRTIRELMGLE